MHRGVREQYVNSNREITQLFEKKKKHFQSRTKKQNIQSSKANFSFKVLTIWIRNSIKFKISKILSEYLHQLGSHHWSPIETTQLRVSGLLTMI